MKEKAKLFVGAMGVTLVLIGALAGFLLVDLSTDRYMPGQLPSIFTIDQVDSQGASLTFMGQTYTLNARRVGQVQELLWEHRGALPAELRLAGGLAVRLVEEYEAWQIEGLG